jgi:D-arabinose 1-dehydrogenase-like Zn-dependent alcohol dehydrogenase
VDDFALREPMVLGHEVAGEVGPNVTQTAPFGTGPISFITEEIIDGCNYISPSARRQRSISG